MQNSRDHMETHFHPLRLGYENLVLIHMLNRKSFSVFQILKPLSWCRERQQEKRHSFNLEFLHDDVSKAYY